MHIRFENLSRDRGKLIEIACELPRSIFRLLKDAVFLYENKSFSSSFVLSTYAMEELAKLFVVLDCLNPENQFDLRKRADKLEKAFKEHTFKQIESIRILGNTIDFCKRNRVHFLAWGMSSKYSEERIRKLYELFDYARTHPKSRFLDRERLNNIYVNWTENGKVNIPGIDEKRVFEQIEMVFDLFQLFILAMTFNPQLKVIVKPFKTKLAKSCPSLETLSRLSEKIYFPKIEKEMRTHMRNIKKGEG